ncbi:MAG TPA: hypothetical protein VK031_09835 [Tissierellaceae bacterium]|nr:hypothetical protein [Tissierellaceae bacterium]
MSKLKEIMDELDAKVRKLEKDYKKMKESIKNVEEFLIKNTGGHYLKSIKKKRKAP